MDVLDILSAMAGFVESVGLQPFIYAALIATAAIKIGQRLSQA